MTALEHEKKQLKKANVTLAEKAKKLEEELSFVRCVLFAWTTAWRLGVRLKIALRVVLKLRLTVKW